MASTGHRGTPGTPDHHYPEVARCQKRRLFGYHLLRISSMLRLAQHGLMQTRLTDRCPGSHLSTSFATKAATNAAPSNRALALAFSSVRALEQFHARARELPFHGLFYGP